MKIIKRLGLALVAVLALSAFTASIAGAYEWQISGGALTKPAEVSGTSTITFKNLAEGYAFRCAIVDKGTVGPGAKGEITSIASSGGAKSIPCELTSSSVDCESAMEIEAVGLPWTTELAGVNGDLRNKLTAAHEWKVKCKEAGGVARSNLCGVPGSTGPHNLTTSVEEIYDSSSPTHTSCFDDSAGEFVAEGAEILSTTAGALQVSPNPLEWRLGGTILTEPAEPEWSGKIKLTDAKVNETVECEATVKGHVGLGGGGEVTALATANCTGKAEVGTCEKGKKTVMEAVSLPWYTELQTIGGVTRDVMVSSGKGTPGFKMSCAILGIKVEDECTGGVNLATTNITSGVSAVLNAGEKLNCTRGGTGQGTVEGTQTIKVSGSKLEVS